MLEIKNISKTYSRDSTKFTALNDVTFKIEEGDFIAIVGASGSGKSTLLNTIGGLIRPDSGHILFRGEDLYSLDNKSADLYRAKSVGFVFQQFHLIPYLTVYENIQMAGNDLLSDQIINQYLKKCDLLALKSKYPSELSVGEKQRTAFIRAIISNPDILLADEPTGNLDPDNSRILMSLVADFHRDGGTVILVSHQVETSEYASKIITLQSGKLKKTVK